MHTGHICSHVRTTLGRRVLHISYMLFVQNLIFLIFVHLSLYVSLLEYHL